MDIDISGTTGATTRQGYNNAGELITTTPLDLLREFGGFLARYNELAATAEADAGTYEEITTKCYLVFRAFAENVHLKAEVIEFVHDRNSAKSRVGSDWTLRLRAYAPVDPDEPSSIFGSWGDAVIDATTACVSYANNLVATANTVTGNITAGLEKLEEPLRALEETTLLLSNLGESVTGLQDQWEATKNLPESYTVMLLEVNQAFEDAVHTAKKETADPSGKVDAAVRGMAQAARLASDAAQVACGASGVGKKAKAAYKSAVDFSATKTTGTKQAFSMVDSATENSSSPKPETIVPFAGDLGVLAAYYYGDRSRWREIAKYNGFLNATTNSDGSPIQLGASIRIPNVGKVLSVGGVGEGDSYGRDLKMVKGDLSLNGSLTDFETLTGGALLEQAIANRLLTTQGHSKQFPQYGLPLRAGDAMGGAMVAYVASHVRQQLLRDPRFINITKMQIQDNGDGYGLALEVIPNAGAAIDVIAPL
jgi:hypothetical protein